VSLSDGAVTRTEFNLAQSEVPVRSGRGGGSPRPERFVPKGAERRYLRTVFLDSPVRRDISRIE
jgi:hypothetical protein